MAVVSLIGLVTDLCGWGFLRRSKKEEEERKGEREVASDGF